MKRSQDVTPDVDSRKNLVKASPEEITAQELPAAAPDTAVAQPIPGNPADHAARRALKPVNIDRVFPLWKNQCVDTIEMREGDQVPDPPHNEAQGFKINFQNCETTTPEVFWLNRQNNWGDRSGENLRGYDRVSFWARGEDGGEKIEFAVGGVVKRNRQYSDSFRESSEVTTLTEEWQQYSIDLDSQKMAGVVGVFSWRAMQGDSGSHSSTIYLDQILLHPSDELVGMSRDVPSAHTYQIRDVALPHDSKLTIENGVVKEFTVSAATMVGEKTLLPSGTRVILHQDGPSRAISSTPIRVDGIAIGADAVEDNGVELTGVDILGHNGNWSGPLAEDTLFGKLRLRKGLHVDFLYDNLCFVPRRSIKIRGLSFGAGAELCILKNGHPSSGELDKPGRIGNTFIPAGASIGASGEWPSYVWRIVVGDFHSPIRFGTILVAGTSLCVQRCFGQDMLVALHPNGNLSAGSLIKRTVIKGLVFEKATRVDFHANGQLERGTLAKDGRLGSLLLRGECEVTFYPNGGIESAMLAKDQEIDGFSLLADTAVYFSPNGRLESGTLAEDLEVQGTVFSRNAAIKIGENRLVEAGEGSDITCGVFRWF